MIDGHRMIAYCSELAEFSNDEIMDIPKSTRNAMLADLVKVYLAVELALMRLTMLDGDKDAI